MSFFDNMKNDFKKDAIGVEKQLDTANGRKWTRYAIYGIVAILLLSLATCTFKSCTMDAQQHKDYIRSVGQDYPAQQVPVQQPMVVQQPGMSPVTAGLLGATAGYIIGKSLMPDGSVYRGTPEQKTIIEKHYIQTHPQEQIKQDAKNIDTATAKPASVPVAKVAEKKVAPGDAAAEAEKAKMKAEQEQKAKQEALKADLKAKQEARAKAASSINLSKPSAPAKSSFSSFSKSVSSKRK